MIVFPLFLWLTEKNDGAIMLHKQWRKEEQTMKQNLFGGLYYSFYFSFTFYGKAFSHCAA